MNRRGIILSVAALGVAGFGGATWYVNRPAPASKTETVAPELAEALIRPYSPILGPEDAPVTIVEFFDPACEACRAFHPIVKDIIGQHGDAVRVVIRYTPFHGEGSEVAIRVLEAARMQGVFEPVLEAVLRDQPQWASHGGMRPELLIGLQHLPDWIRKRRRRNFSRHRRPVFSTRIAPMWKLSVCVKHRPSSSTANRSIRLGKQSCAVWWQLRSQRPTVDA